MAEHGLTAAQWHPAVEAEVGKAATAQELACQLGVDAGAMTRLLDRLEAKGLVERVRSSSDRRVVELSLTDAGEAAIAHVPAVLAEVNNKHLRGFSATSGGMLKELLGRMLANSAEAPSSPPASPGRRAGAREIDPMKCSRCDAQPAGPVRPVVPCAAG